MERIAALFRDPARALEAAQALERAGLLRTRIIDASAVRGMIPHVRSAAPEGALLGSLFGVIGGGTTALVAFIVPDALFGIDGLVHVIRAGAAAGGIVGLLAGIAIGMATPEPQARLYAKDAMAEGQVVLVDVDEPREARMAKRTLAAFRGVEMARHAPPVSLRRPLGARPVTG